MKIQPAQAFQLLKPALEQLKILQDLTGGTGSNSPLWDEDSGRHKKYFTALRAFQAAVADFDTKFDSGGQAAEFSDFFAAVGDSMVRAQQKLDVQSARYLRELQDHPYLMPAVFRVPKLSAHMRFALKSVTSDKLNVIFYQREKEVEETIEQSVDFEIVAAPPPDHAAVADSFGLDVDLLVSPTARAPILETFWKSKPGHKKTAPTSRRLLIVPTTAGPHGLNSTGRLRQFFIVFAYQKEGAHLIQLWHMTQEGEQADVVAAKHVDAQTVPAMAIWHAVDGIQDKQELLLTPRAGE